jgi:hypothetical protein
MNYAVALHSINLGRELHTILHGVLGQSEFNEELELG